MHEPTSELKSSREGILKKSPGDSDALPDLGIQLTEVHMGSEPWLPQMENGNNF